MLKIKHSNNKVPLGGVSIYKILKSTASNINVPELTMNSCIILDLLSTDTGYVFLHARFLFLDYIGHHLTFKVNL